MEVAASEFYHGVYFTAFEPGEILTSISIAVPCSWSRLRPGWSEHNSCDLSPAFHPATAMCVSRPLLQPQDY